MSSVFNGYGIYKPMYGIWQFIKDIPFLVKCCHQRIHKGYCVKDTWDIDQWFVSTLKPMLQELRDNHRGFPSYFIDEFWQQHKDVMGMSYEEFVSWHPEEDLKWQQWSKKGQDYGNQRWNEILERMVLLLNEMEEDTCFRKNPYDEEWYSFHERFNEKYPKGGDELKTKEELAEERKTGSKRLAWPSEDPEFGKEYESAWEKKNAYDKELLEYREKCKNEFMDLFKEHLRSLWD